MPGNNVLSIYVDSDNKAVLVCPHCNRQKVIQADEFKGQKRELQIRCICQNVTSVYLEFRNFPRKKTQLQGTYINNSQKDCAGSFTIFNLSVSGVGFTCEDADSLKVGDNLTIKFTLDEERKIEINKEVIVRYVRQQSVGCEFLEKEKPFEGPLGLYVMSN